MFSATPRDVVCGCYIAAMVITLTTNFMHAIIVG